MKPSEAASARVVLVDSGPLVAAIDASDPHHGWARATLPRLPGRMITCEAVAAEVLHLVGNGPRAVEAAHAFLRRMKIAAVLADELEAVFSSLKRYAPRMDLADGCLLALSARHADALVLTTDTADFAAYRVPFASPQGLFAEF